MISPASMKKGTASSGKLLAPSMVFCARICASNMSMCHISAAPQASSEKAMGTPSAMAPSSAPRKMAMVMRGLLSRAPRLRRRAASSSDSMMPISSVLGEPAGQQLPEFVEQDQRRPSTANSTPLAKNQAIEASIDGAGGVPS